MFNNCGSWLDYLPQLVAVLSATTSTISDGMQYGWSGPIIPVLQRSDTPIKIKEEDIVWIEGIYMIGGFVGQPITVFLVEKLGRKYSIIAASSSTLVAWIMIAATDSVVVLFVARLITGIAANCAFVSCPMYIAEIADKKIRGFLGALIFIMQKVGIVLIYCVAPFVSVTISCVVGMGVIALQLCTFPFMPDSPYHLLIRGKDEAAKKALTILRNGKNVEEEFLEIKAAVERQESEKGGFMEVFKNKSNRKGITIMTYLNGAQHMCSMTAMIMNLHLILEDAGSALSPNTAGIIFSCLMLASSTLAGIIVDKTGRKVLLIVSSILTGISLGVLATYFAFKNANYDVLAYNWVPAASVMVYAVVFKIGLGIIPIVLTAELFPTSVKAYAMATADAMYVVFSVTSIYLYQFLAQAYGNHVPFYVFTAFSILTTIYVIIFVPETKGKTLEEIQFMLKGQKYVSKQIK